VGAEVCVYLTERGRKREKVGGRGNGRELGEVVLF